MLEKKDINELMRRLELAAQQSDQAAQEARAQLAREAGCGTLGETRMSTTLTLLGRREAVEVHEI